MTLRLGILISGGGTTMVNLHDRIKAGGLDAEIVRVISSKSKVVGLDRARNMGYPVKFLGRRRFESDEAYSDAINEDLLEHRVDMVILAGFLRRYLPGEPFRNRCLNIHPSLLPAFGGKGFYGMKVHEAVWARSCKVSGCTVHLVNDEYDDGPIVVQKSVAVNDRDTPENIRDKVFALECEAYPEAIEHFAKDRIRIVSGRCVIGETPGSTKS